MKRKDTWTKEYCVDCSKLLSYQGSSGRHERCQSCSHKLRAKNKPWTVTNGFKRGNTLGKRFYSGQPASKYSFKKGHKHSLDVLMKLSLANRGKRRSIATEFKPLSFKKSTRTKGHLTTKEYTGWRRDVFFNDNFTCFLCDKRGGKLHAHHIKPWSEFPELRYEVFNGVTLCVDCHKQIHHP